ncbi:hypothetical protein ACFOQM_23530 [Paenibacillus sp. GCM10012307]|uniref:Uncharacterized protein n=1 Tax=Paenibacillus roseus TaxID=2798579 RepID=A0A934MN84_9BACL|nr:hypothetical protein [Paenibacillus roseus]MBJ6364195.1 hypothetical protein [Paenibacillus roseus]
MSRDGVRLTVIKCGNWEVDGKYEHCEVIFTDGDRNYRSYASRSGSYFSDYSYTSEWDDGDADVEEVRKVSKTIEVWEAV